MANQPAPPPTGNITNPPQAGANANAANAANTQRPASTIDTNGRRSSSASNARRDETINYEVDRTIRHTQQKAGNPQHCPSTWAYLLQLCERELEQLTRTRSLRERITQKLDHEPSPEEIANLLEKPVAEVKRMLGLNERVSSNWCSTA